MPAAASIDGIQRKADSEQLEILTSARRVIDDITSHIAGEALLQIPFQSDTCPVYLQSDLHSFLCCLGSSTTPTDANCREKGYFICWSVAQNGHELCDLQPHDAPML